MAKKMVPHNDAAAGMECPAHAHESGPDGYCMDCGVVMGAESCPQCDVQGGHADGCELAEPLKCMACEQIGHDSADCTAFENPMDEWSTYGAYCETCGTSHAELMALAYERGIDSPVCCE